MSPVGEYSGGDEPSPPNPLSQALGEGEQETSAIRLIPSTFATNSPSPNAWERGLGGEGSSPVYPSRHPHNAPATLNGSLETTLAA